MSDILKLDWVEEDKLLKFKIMDEKSPTFKPVLVLSLEKPLVESLLVEIRNSILDRTAICTSIGLYDINIYYNLDGSIKLSVMECVGQKSKPLGKVKFSKYQGNISLLDGIRKFKNSLN